MISSAYAEMRPSEEPLRRITYANVSWIANTIAILGGVYSIFAYSSVISMIITVFYCINIYVLLGDYERWLMMRKIIMIALLSLLGVDTLVLIIEYYFVFKAGYYNEKREGEKVALYMLWGSFFFEVTFLLASFLTTYFLYPDQLSLLSQEHPARMVIEQTVQQKEGETKRSQGSSKRDAKMFLEEDDEINAVITKEEEGGNKKAGSSSSGIAPIGGTKKTEALVSDKTAKVEAIMEGDKVKSEVIVPMQPPLSEKPKAEMNIVSNNNTNMKAEKVVAAAPSEVKVENSPAVVASVVEDSKK